MRRVPVSMSNGSFWWYSSRDYREEIYTKAGIDWVEENSMVNVISRHFPKVAFAMQGMDNAFQPWKPR